MGAGCSTGRRWFVALPALVTALALPTSASAASPPAATLTPDADAQAATTWSGSAGAGSETLQSDLGAGCFTADGSPNPVSGCDFFALDVNVPDGFYGDHPGALNVNVSGFGLADLDLYIYRRAAGGKRGEYVTGDGQSLGVEENAGIDRPQGSYIVVLTPYTTIGPQSYKASARLATRRGPTRAQLEQAAPPGVTNYRASHDKYTSHSEPTIAMDPLDHNHLIAGSKMFENNDRYLFKVGTYESRDGGRTWEDQGQLPGYCAAPGQCDPGDEARYRTTSDPSIAFDDEGDAYANVLDAPGGTFAFQGFNMTVHTKRPGQHWSGPTTVHDNRRTGLTQQLLLDDKNWIAVDNHTDVNGRPNRPHDGKIGTMYVCWSLDAAVASVQQIVVMRSRDGGKTWGGILPGDNLPYPVSLKTYLSGIGCHVAIGPHGEVYITWYDYQLNALMQAKSTNRGATWSLQAPIAGISGLKSAFAGEAFRNFSIPTSAVDPAGNVYVAVASHNGAGRPLLGNLFELGKDIKAGKLGVDELRKLLSTGDEEDGTQVLAGGDGSGPASGSDIVLFKSTNGGRSYSGPVRVNQDPVNGDGDQFQPWMAITESGQINISFFDRRNDPGNYFIDTYLAQSEDSGRTFHDQRVSQRMWDPAAGAPTSVSGKFIGDYQGLVADDDVAIPFWNDTQLAGLPPTDKRYSPYQEVFAARVPGDPISQRSRCFPRRLAITRRSIGKVGLGQTRARVGKRLGPPVVTRRGVLRFCVKGGGSALVAFDKRGRVRFAATTATQHRRLKIGRGSSLAALHKRFGARLRSVFGGVMGVRGGSSRAIVFGVRGRRVRYVAVLDHSLLHNKRALRRQLRKAALLRAPTKARG